VWFKNPKYPRLAYSNEILPKIQQPMVSREILKTTSDNKPRTAGEEKSYFKR
jgi:hypothetical protein